MAPPLSKIEEPTLRVCLSSDVSQIKFWLRKRLSFYYYVKSIMKLENSNDLHMLTSVCFKLLMVIVYFKILMIVVKNKNKKGKKREREREREREISLKTEH